MFNEHVITKQAIYTSKIPKILPIDFKKVKENILLYHKHNIVKNPSDWSYLNQYYRVDMEKNISWLSHFIIDHIRLQYDMNLIIKDIAALIQNKNEEINFTDHIDDYDLNESPDYSCVTTIQKGKSPAFIEFEYQNGRHRHQKFRELLKPNKIIIFNSNISHRYSKNLDTKKIINLSFKFQKFV